MAFPSGASAVLLASLVAMASAAVSPSGYSQAVRRGEAELRAGHPDAAVEAFLEAHAAGMPKDSLYYFLAAAARRKSALDTAMGFNLAIGTPVAGPFRDSVWTQRLGLYTSAGLRRDAAALRDSLGLRFDGASGRRRLNALFGSGFFREREFSARSYPFGDGMGDYRTAGWQHQIRGGFSLPWFRAGGTQVSGGIGMQALKSYAKDSLDYRIGAEAQAEGFSAGHLSFGAGLETGRVTGSGWIGACKGDATWLSLRGEGVTLITGGMEAEWDQEGGERFQSAWLSWYRDGTVRKGRGFIFTLSVLGLRLDPISESTVFREMFVDDVGKEKPTHYGDATSNDSITGSRITRFTNYTSNVGNRNVTSRSPQSFLSAQPSVEYALPLIGKITAALTLSAGGAWYPSPYRWEQGPRAPMAPASDGFQGLALNRADGREYAATLIRENGGVVRESYADRALEKQARTRLDGQGAASAGLRRAFGSWGALACTAKAKRNFSNLAGEAPVWIPDWDFGISAAWSGAWAW